jgi:hypothetical protein
MLTLYNRHLNSTLSQQVISVKDFSVDMNETQSKYSYICSRGILLDYLNNNLSNTCNICFINKLVVPLSYTVKSGVWQKYSLVVTDNYTYSVICQWQLLLGLTDNYSVICQQQLLLGLTDNYSCGIRGWHCWFACLLMTDWFEVWGVNEFCSGSSRLSSWALLAGRPCHWLGSRVGRRGEL